MSKYRNTYHGNCGEVYWKLYKSTRNDLITIVCMQWFDEADYYEENFVRNSSDEIHTFESEELAKDKLNEWYKPEEIDPEYIKASSRNLVRD